jgi:hypothetical protein
MLVKWIGILAAITTVIAIIAAACFAAYVMGRETGRNEALDAHARLVPESVESTPTWSAQDSGVRSAVPASMGGTGVRKSPSRHLAGGQVKSVSGDIIELSTLAEVIRVKVDAQTQIQRTVAITLTDLRPGERVFIQGERAGDGSFIARTIQAESATAGSRGAAGGQ